MNGFHTRSALVRHAERRLGIKNRPLAAREIVCGLNPIPQPTPHRTTSDREHSVGAALSLGSLALAAFLIVVFALAQVTP